MKTPYMHIYKILRLNRFVVLTVLLISFGSSVISMVQVRKAYKELLNKAFVVNSDGSVVPISLVDQRENLEVEARAHLELFHRYFYDLSTSNYEAHLEKALWLGNSSVDEAYRQKKADGVYNRLLQYSLVQRVTSIQSELDLSAAPFAFRTVVHFEVNRGSTTDRYELITTGYLVRVDRNFPKNPHGLLITDFFENSLKKLQDDNQ
ncbi:conjugal transfer protein TraK [Christiangramia fulva]|uniref:Conjugal transfer protein TraK n=1 Tax=Christiangramia fulva TaxID=2126553 RepID=A0A2R3ZAD3_9FLAO|nr:conjugal transfer protein TraK [Christiangramia fulva]AVR47184.1 conjugal transfer protein TraK [Christiangramia fulva]